MKSADIYRINLSSLKWNHFYQSPFEAIRMALSWINYLGVEYLQMKLFITLRSIIIW